MKILIQLLRFCSRLDKIFLLSTELLSEHSFSPLWNNPYIRLFCQLMFLSSWQREPTARWGQALRSMKPLSRVDALTHQISHELLSTSDVLIGICPVGITARNLHGLFTDPVFQCFQNCSSCCRLSYTQVFISWSNRRRAGRLASRKTVVKCPTKLSSSFYPHCILESENVKLIAQSSFN